LAFVVNLLCHVCILLTFLTLFFFEYVSKLTTENIDGEMKSLVEAQTDQLLQYVDQRDTQHQIRWDLVDTAAQALAADSNHAVRSIVEHNTQLYDQTLGTLGLLVLVIVLLSGYLVWRGVDLQFKFIVLENLIIFAFVGMIEVYFFMNIASQYVPVLPDEALRAIFARLKTNLNG